jgi:hypothetical protein
MSEWFVGAPPLSYFTIGWPLLAGALAALVTSAPPPRRLALFLFGALSCYGIYFVTVSAALLIPICPFSEATEATAMVEQAKAWHQCGIERSVLIAALIGIPCILWLAHELKVTRT